MSSPIALRPEPASNRPFAGLGVQADGWIYNDLNRQAGVTEAGCAIWEGRLKALRPAIARVFLPLTDFNPSMDGTTFEWDAPAMQHQIRNLKVLREAGARVNLCMGPATNGEMLKAGRECRAVDVLEHLVQREGLDHIAWLSLFNEPDGFYDYDGLPEDPGASTPRRPWAEYVEKHVKVLDLLAARGLADTVRLEVADTVAPHRLRAARLRLAHRDFKNHPVSYGFHHYAADYPGYYAHPDSQPYAPPPMPDEVRAYREAVGRAAELICWEYNDAGYGFGTFWPGSGPRGEDHTGTFRQAAAHSRKVLAMLAAGVDGVAHWCAGDAFYPGALAHGPMRFGLWRFGWEQWIPRPVFFTFAALIETFPTGSSIHGLDHLPSPLAGASTRRPDGSTVIAVVNPEPAPASVPLPDLPGARILRVGPETLPIRGDSPAHARPEMDLPLTDWQSLDTAASLTLNPFELVLVRTPPRTDEESA